MENASEHFLSSFQSVIFSKPYLSVQIAPLVQTEITWTSTIETPKFKTRRIFRGAETVSPTHFKRRIEFEAYLDGKQIANRHWERVYKREYIEKKRTAAVAVLVLNS